MRLIFLSIKSSIFEIGEMKISMNVVFIKFVKVKFVFINYVNSISIRPIELTETIFAAQYFVFLSFFFELQPVTTRGL